MITNKIIFYIIAFFIILVIAFIILIYSNWLDPLLSELIAVFDPIKSIFI